ncbi:hypothetical protein BFL38_06290 [Brachyspira hampsonii]|uniref:Uncharacterized protein n=1 Tax=Brachyspira hampsonii TaxID=1287055 RepID=A0A1E5NE63_9SPIR|nr:hypothetical protein [Brachyspira hampsonii]OEJ14435.1 hypothetical protein BFL38_06290 [Brachyspira hampsonii]
MEKLSKYNINFIVSAISSLVIISMCAYMILNLPAYIMKILMFIEFLCSFYFVCVLFYKMNKYSRIETFFYLIIYLVPFILSILGLFYITNFFSLNRVFLRENIISSFLTRGYHVLFIFYISHIIYFFYLFSIENKNTFYALISSNFIIVISVIMAVIFIVLYGIINWVFDNKIITSYEDKKNEIIYEAGLAFSQNADRDELEYEGFAKSYEMVLVYYDNELKYRSEDWDNFERSNLLFEVSIMQGNGFLFMGSGKEFIYPYYMFILIYVIINSIILTCSIMFFKLFLERKFNGYVNIMIKGFKEDSYIYAIDTDKMDDTEIKKLSELYNKKLLTYKYRERFIKMFTR